MVQFAQWYQDAQEDTEADRREPITESEAMEQFDQMLDECYPVVHVAGYDYDVSRALKELDPVAYRQEFLNYCDAEGIDLDW